MKNIYPASYQDYRKQFVEACTKFDTPQTQAEGFRRMVGLRDFEASIDALPTVALLHKSKAAASLTASLSARADDGSGEKQYLLGWAAHHGIGTEKDSGKAEKLWEMAASKGHVQAQTILGEQHLEKNEVTGDERKDIPLIKEAAEQGHARAESILGSYYFSRNKMAEAMEWLTKAATHGDAQAQTNLGACHFSGEGGQKDLIKSVEWLEKAAIQGQPDAKKMLPLMVRQRDKDQAKVLSLMQNEVEMKPLLAKMIGAYLETHYIEPNDKKSIAAALEHCFSSIQLPAIKEEKWVDVVGVRGEERQVVKFAAKLPEKQTSFAEAEKGKNAGPRPPGGISP